MSHAILTCPACGYMLVSLQVRCPLCDVDPLVYVGRKS